MLKTTSSATGYALSGNLSDGSINVWSTQLGLNLAGGYNFKKQVHSEPSQEKAKEVLPHENYEKVGDYMHMRDKRFIGEILKLEEPVMEAEIAVEIPETEEKEEGYEDPFGFQNLFVEESSIHVNN